MSDYLWDKTGEADAEVERLEALLGSFAHRPRPLEAPAPEVAAAEPRRPALLGGAWRFRRPRLFAPAGLAAAAAVLLALFVGASLWLRGTADGGQAASRPSRPAAQNEAAPSKPDPPKSDPSKSDPSKSDPSRSDPSKSEQARSAPGAPMDARGAADAAPRVGEAVRAAVEGKVSAVEAKAAAASLKGEKVASGEVARVAPGRKDARGAAEHGRRAKSEPAAREGGGEVFTAEAMRGGGASALLENTRMLTKEQLVYALRLTGAKLRDVRQRAQGFDGQKPPLR